VRYAHNGDVAIAYQIFGEGPINLVCVPGFVSNLYWNWDLPEFRRMLTGLGSFARVAIMDRRGVGLSDRLSPKDLPSLEVVMDDILTVMDDAGIERAAVFGWQSGATHAALLAATHPARVSRLEDMCVRRAGLWHRVDPRGGTFTARAWPVSPAGFRGVPCGVCGDVSRPARTTPMPRTPRSRWCRATTAR
jgi:pimeloyl-ACP methyl ester carboxylesterase